MPVDYQRSKIYTLSNNVDDIIYIGSTAQAYLSSRMSAHRIASKNESRTSPIYTAMRLHGTNTFKMLLHHTFPCNSKDELEAEEYRTMHEYLNTGYILYNEQTERRKHSSRTIDKMTLTRSHTPCNFKHGCVYLSSTEGAPRWVIRYSAATNEQKCRSFGCKKFGFWGAKNECDKLRKHLYPEYQTKEERCIESFGNINMN